MRACGVAAVAMATDDARRTERIFMACLKGVEACAEGGWHRIH